MRGGAALPKLWWGLLALLALAPSSARAQDHGADIREELCLGVGLPFAKPAVAEWTTWLGFGGGVDGTGQRGAHRTWAARAGGAVDFSAARFGRKYQYGGLMELRLGPWLGAETLGDVHALEGGLHLDLGQVSHAQWGSLALRVGAAAVHRDDRWRGAGTATLAWGVRSVPARYSDGGGCVGARGELTTIDTGAPRRAHAYASGMRVFATMRVEADGHATVLVGIEVEPSFFFPPYSLGRLGGARPY